MKFLRDLVSRLRPPPAASAGMGQVSNLPETPEWDVSPDPGIPGFVHQPEDARPADKLATLLGKLPLGSIKAAARRVDAKIPARIPRKALYAGLAALPVLLLVLLLRSGGGAEDVMSSLEPTPPLLIDLATATPEPPIPTIPPDALLTPEPTIESSVLMPVPPTPTPRPTATLVPLPTPTATPLPTVQLPTATTAPTPTMGNLQVLGIPPYIACVIYTLDEEPVMGVSVRINDRTRGSKTPLARPKLTDFAGRACFFVTPTTMGTTGAPVVEGWTWERQDGVFYFPSQVDNPDVARDPGPWMQTIRVRRCTGVDGHVVVTRADGSRRCPYKVSETAPW